jgi:putative ABC transport system permease protein
MFLALRELAFARARFGLMGAVIALIAVLMVMLSGLSVGLVNDGVSGLQKLPVTAFAFEKHVQHDAAFSRSVVDDDAVRAWREQPDVAAATPYGNSLVNARSDGGVEIDLALFGVEPDAFLAPPVSQGSRLSTPDGIVVSTTAVTAGLRVGDTVTLDRLGTRLTVVGVTTGQHTFGHVDVAFVPLGTWQRIKAGVGPDGPLPDRAARESTAVALRAKPGRTLDLAAGDAVAGTESLTLEQSYGASPGYTAESTTLRLIQGFLYAISALVAGAFFAVWVIQRKHEVAILRAMGAPAGWVLRDALVQALVLMVGAVSAGAAVGVGLGAFITGGGVPFALSAPDIAAAAAGLILLGLVGAAVAVARVVSVEPATALGGNR